MPIPSRLRPLGLLPLLLGAVLPAGRLAAQAPPAPALHGVDLATIDPSVLPCRDFYQYANGKWLAANPVPADRSIWGGMSEVGERNSAVLHSILDRALSGPPAPIGSAPRKVADFYRSGMDTGRIEQAGAKPLAPEFDRIAAVRDTPGLLAEIAHLHSLGIRVGWGLGVGPDDKDSAHTIVQLGQGGLGLPDRDYYTKTDDKSRALRDAYVAHIARMFVLLGDAPDTAAAEALTVLGIETRLASASMTRLARRDPNATYHKLTPAQFDALAPGVSWRPYFAALGIADPGPLLVGQPQFFGAVGGMLSSVPLADWKTYGRWHLVNSTADDLSAPFVTEHFLFFGKTLSGSPALLPRWKRVLAQTDGSLGEGLGALYVAQSFPPPARARALSLVLNLKSALRDRLEALDWIGPDTRRQALLKLDKMSVKIGYPDRPRLYSRLTIGSPDYVLNVLASRHFEFERGLRKLNHPVDRTEWGMSAPTVNAYYRPDVNEIVFPAGILQPPFFDAQADDASNYGAIGAVIGHEMTHGFDDQGRQFDANGNLKDWWTAADKKNFQARADMVAHQFDSFVAVDDLHVNGRLTLGEDIADLGGLKIAFLAFEKSQVGKPHILIGGFTPEQRFFLAFAQVWRTNTRPEALRLRVATDPHAPARFRVLGPLANMPEFAQAFPCPAGEPAGAMAQTVSIW